MQYNPSQSKRSEFVAFVISSCHEACTALYPKRKTYPLDSLAEEEITFYAEILFARGAWCPFDPTQYEQPAAVHEARVMYERWERQNLDRACEEFCLIINQILDRRAEIKLDLPFWIMPDMRGRKADFKAKLSSLASEEMAQTKPNRQNLALNA